MRNDVDTTGEIFADNIWSCAEIIGVIVFNARLDVDRIRKIVAHYSVYGMM
jgi:hypothetical protein